MSLFRADLHIHSCLSPCASLENSPRAIAHHAKARGLQLVALTDHNTALNAPAFASACRQEGIQALFGMEITTREEVHALTLFPDAQTAVKAGNEVYERLKSGPFNPESFGDQIWVNDEEEIEGFLEKLLILGTTDLSLDDLVPWAEQFGGICIPAHIDRPVFGTLGVLGFLPPANFTAVESTTALDDTLTNQLPVIASSDAHELKDIGQRFFTFNASHPSFDALIHAFESKSISAHFCP
ncbi:MAG: PHP domain-containing protein [Spirochaetales bacterium]|nr:PHP domain-containing protein [Spirochaetales bacterium]